MAIKNVGHQRYKVTISIIVISVFLLSKCINTGNEQKILKADNGKNDTDQIANVPGYNQYAGSLSCAKCHANISRDFIHTAHYLTSQTASKKSIKGSFINGKNTFAFDNGAALVMEQRKDSLYQVLYFNGAEQKAEPFDITVGSGIMGQSFLYWKNNSLYQLPVTYFTAAHQWSNSPGFPNKPVFNRDITTRCLECHSTYVNTISALNSEPAKFDRKQIVYAVGCEKCHGPAAKHVAYQTQNPKDTTANFIVNPSELSRQQNLDICALCHSGRLQKIQPSFGFVAGDTLSDFFKLSTEIPDPNNVDVHGNQYGLLRSSKCFRMNNEMTCNTCHNTHKNERNNTALFSERCMSCHNTEHENVCKLAEKIGSVIKTNCIDCHMPLHPSKAIAVFLPGKSAPTAAMIRTHYITVYPEETGKVIAYMKKNLKAK